MAQSSAASPCFGCCLNPGFINPNPFDPSPFQQPKIFPTFINTHDFVKLTLEEKEILQKLGEAYNLYRNLDKRSEADDKEFTDGVHRLQQLIALRVARRVDLDVWAQPE